MILMTMDAKLFAGVFCTVFAGALMLSAATGKKLDAKGVEAAITKMEMDNVKADVAGDSSWMTREMTDNYTMGTSWGAFETKSELVKDAADTANNKTNTREISELKERVYGDNTTTAIFRRSNDWMINGEHH